MKLNDLGVLLTEVEFEQITALLKEQEVEKRLKSKIEKTQKAINRLRKKTIPKASKKKILSLIEDLDNLAVEKRLCGRESEIEALGKRIRTVKVVSEYGEPSERICAKCAMQKVCSNMSKTTDICDLVMGSFSYLKIVGDVKK